MLELLNGKGSRVCAHCAYAPTPPSEAKAPPPPSVSERQAPSVAAADPKGAAQPAPPARSFEGAEFEPAGRELVDAVREVKRIVAESFEELAGAAKRIAKLWER